MELARESAYSKEQLEAYDRYWDAVSTERTLITGKAQEARTAALAEGKAEGLVEGLELALKKMTGAGISEAEAKKILGME